MERRIQIVLVLVLATVVVVAGVVAYVRWVPSSAPTTPPGPTGTATCPAGANGSGGNWTTYHGDNARSGLVSRGPVSSAHPTWSGPVSLDGQVYAQPLVCGADIFVATEDDSVYAINASTGAVLWRSHLGTPVPSSALPCGDIDPSGITGTPVIDVATGTLYVVAFVMPAPEHELFALSVANGSVRSEVPVDPPGVSATVEQQRGALALANGLVYVPFGGLYGDCGAYHGFVEGVPTAGTGSILSYQVPTQREGAIWGPAGMAVAPNGSLYVSTGNGASTSTFDFGDAVVELTPALHEVDYFAPTDWAQLNRNDQDLGSEAPTLLDNGVVFQIGKSGVGYVLAGGHLGGIGGELGEQPVCAGAYGGTAHVGLSMLVPCTNGLFDLAVGATNFTETWRSASFDAGTPVVTGGVVWVTNESTAELLGLNLSTGHVLYSFPLGQVDHFVSPATTPTSVLVAGGSGLYSFSLS